MDLQSITAVLVAVVLAYLMAKGSKAPKSPEQKDQDKGPVS